MLGRSRWGNLVHGWRSAAAQAIAPSNAHTAPSSPIAPLPVVPPARRERNKIYTDISNWGPYTTFAGVLNPTQDGGAQAAFAFALEHRSRLLRVGSKYLYVPPHNTTLTEAWAQWFALQLWQDRLKGTEVTCYTDNFHAIKVVKGKLPTIRTNSKLAIIPVAIASGIETAVSETARSHDMKLAHMYATQAQNTMADRLSQCHTAELRWARISEKLNELVEESERAISRIRPSLLGGPVEGASLYLAGDLSALYAPTSSALFFPLRTLQRITSMYNVTLGHIRLWRTAAGRAMLSSRTLPSHAAVDTSNPDSAGQEDDTVAIGAIQPVKPGVGRKLSKRVNKATAKRAAAIASAAPAGALSQDAPALLSAIASEHPVESGIPPPAPHVGNFRSRRSASVRSQFGLRRAKYEVRTRITRHGVYHVIGGALHVPGRSTPIDSFSMWLDSGALSVRVGSLSFTTPVRARSVGIYAAWFALSLWRERLAGTTVTCFSTDIRAIELANGTSTDAEEFDKAVSEALKALSRDHQINLQHEHFSYTTNVGVAYELSRYYDPYVRARLSRAIRRQVAASNVRLKTMNLEGYLDLSEVLLGTERATEQSFADSTAASPPNVHASTPLVPDRSTQVSPIASGHMPAIQIESPYTALTPTSTDTLLDTHSETAPAAIDVTASIPHSTSSTTLGSISHTLDAISTPNLDPPSETDHPTYVIRTRSSRRRGLHTTTGGALYLTGGSEPLASFALTLDHQTSSLQVDASCFSPPFKESSIEAYAIMVAMKLWRDQLLGAHVRCLTRDKRASMICQGTLGGEMPDDINVAIGRALETLSKDGRLTIAHIFHPESSNGLVKILSRCHLPYIRATLPTEILAQVEVSDGEFAGMGLKGYVRPSRALEIEPFSDEDLNSPEENVESTLSLPSTQLPLSSTRDIRV